MGKAGVIPIPAKQRWAAFRLKVIPGCVFAATLLGVVHLWRQNLYPPVLAGKIEFASEQVVTPNTGYLTNLHVARFQQVAEGEIVAEIICLETKGKQKQIKQPLLLRSPISGVVTIVYHTAGETVQAGDPIVTIKGEQAAENLPFPENTQLLSSVP